MSDWESDGVCVADSEDVADAVFVGVSDTDAEKVGVADMVPDADDVAVSVADLV